jgi:hypothetical protein
VARLEQLRVPDIEASPAAVESWTAKNAMLQFEDLGPVHRELIAPERGGDRIPLLVGRIAEYRLSRNGPLVSWALGLDEMQTELLQEHLDFIGRAARAKT